MVLKEINYFINGKKRKIKVQEVSVFSTGLMFRLNSPPLLFNLNKEKWFSITGIFCRPFKAIWLDEKMRATKIVDVKNWKIGVSGRGKYLLEVPITTKK
ncbi:MAG: hypothetical protein NUV97_04335 [archaeon]|nr:hypothetical protein [archaeon]